MCESREFVLPVISRGLSPCNELLKDGKTIPIAPVDLSTSAQRQNASKLNFPQRLWLKAMATGQSAEAFWTNGAQFSRDGFHIFYCASVLGQSLGVKAATIAHNIRGYLGNERPRRMSKHTFEELFGSGIRYKGQVWMITIPGLNIRTHDFRNFRWYGKEMVVGDGNDDGDGNSEGIKVDLDDDPISEDFEAFQSPIASRTPEVVDWSILEENGVAVAVDVDVVTDDKFSCDSDWLFPPEHWTR